MASRGVERPSANVPADLEGRRVEVHIPVATIVKVLVTAVVVWAVLQLVPEFLLFLLTLLASITLAPVSSM